MSTIISTGNLSIFMPFVEQHLFNFVNLTVEKLVSIFESKKSLEIKLNDRIASLNKNNLSYLNCFEYCIEEEAKHSLEFSLLDFQIMESL
jgi:hypothetical protein